MDISALVFPVAVLCGALVVKVRLEPGSIVFTSENTLILAAASLVGTLIFWWLSRRTRPLIKYIKSSPEAHDVSNDMDDYEYLERINVGGMSKVNLVRRLGTDKLYALKMLNIHRAFDEGQVSNTLREKGVMTLLNHPFIVKLYTTFKDTSHVCFLLEFLPGGDLFDILKRKGKLSVDDAKFYAANVLAALEYLHSEGIAYRDLKLENLLLDNKGYIKMTDFGMAKILDERSNTFGGTLDYLSPELLSREPYGTYVDYWALGCLIFEMLSGKPPFSGTEEERLKAMQEYDIDFSPDFDPQAKSLVADLLYPEVKHRLGTSSNGSFQIRAHPWFKGFDWEGLMNKEIKAPESGIKKGPLTPLKKLSIKTIKVRSNIEDEPSESPRTYSPKAIDTFFKDF